MHIVFCFFFEFFSAFQVIIYYLIIKEEQRVISRKEAEAYARKSHTLFLECSAKTRYGVKEAFEELVRKVKYIQIFSWSYLY